MPMFQRSRTENGYKAGYLATHAYRQGYVWAGPTPYPDMPFYGRFASTTPTGGNTKLGAMSTRTYMGAFSSERTSAENKAKQRAWGKFQDTAMAMAEMGTLFAERREALGLIASRATTLRQAWLALRMGKFKKFCKLLRVKPKRKHKRSNWEGPQGASELWLEYWFGWAPMLGDIYGAYEALSQDFPFTTVSAYASAPFTYNGSINDSGLKHLWSNQGKVGVGYAAKMRPKNSVLAYANALGVINPAVVVWEVIPFSFLIDWFIPIGGFLRGLTFGYGIEFSERRMTTKVKCNGSEIRTWGTVVEWANTSEASTFNRVLDWVIPKMPVFDPPDRLAITRAATAISLLISMFTPAVRPVASSWR